MIRSWWTRSLLALLVCCFILPLSEAAADSKPIDLQEMLDLAAPGDTVILPPGEYEGPIVVRKPLSLIAENEHQAVLVNNSEDQALRIETDGVSIEGLVIRDHLVKDQATILVSGDNVVLEKLQIETGANGIEARDANEGVVKDSVISWVVDGIRMADKGNGIDLFNAHRWSIHDNVIRDVHDGIYMENSDNAQVTNNVIERSRYGVHCMYTKGTIIRQNEGNLNVTGAMVMTAREVEVSHNIFTKQNENVHSQGILLYDAHDSAFTNNVVEGNRVGLYVEQSSNNRLEHNRVAFNFIGIQLLDAEENEIAGNIFQGNVADAQARGSNHNDLNGNYWDSFRGIDADGDGYSDLSYAINPLFQGLTQKRSAFQLFFQSPGMEFLEGLFETERASWPTDESPLMEPLPMYRENAELKETSATGAIGFVLLSCTSLILYKARRKNG